MRIERMLAITVILLNRKRISARELAEKFEVSVRTVYRDIEAINSAGIPVISYPGSSGGFGIMDTYKIDRQILTLKDMTSILTALKGINAAFENNEIETAMEKISSLVPADKSGQVEKELDQITIDLMPWGYKDKHKEYLKIVRHSIARRQLISFVYENMRYEILRRTVEPMTLIFKGFAWYLFGFCRVKNDFRLFRLSRMKELEMLDGNFERRNASYNEYANYSLSRDNWIKLKLNFSPAVKLRVEEFFSEDIISREDGGDIIVEASFPDDDWICSMILSFGENVEVLSPAHIREKVKEKAENICAVYKHDITVSQL